MSQESRWVVRYVKKCSEEEGERSSRQCFASQNLARHAADHAIMELGSGGENIRNDSRMIRVEIFEETITTNSHTFCILWKK